MVTKSCISYDSRYIRRRVYDYGKLSTSKAIV